VDKHHWFYWRENILYLHIYLQPRASQDKVVGLHDNCLKISLTTPPVEGRDTQHLIRFIAECFAVAKQQVSIEQGELSRKKWVKIVDPENKSILNM